MKCQKSAKNAHPNFQEPSVTSADRFFCPNNSLKHKLLIYDHKDTETQQILTGG